MLVDGSLPFQESAATMQKRTAHQDRIIRNYYENHDSIMVQRLGDLVTDLFLAEGKKRTKLWERAVASLKSLKVPEDRIEHIVGADNPTLLANLLQELQQRQ
jgi:hypothetical protein